MEEKTKKKPGCFENFMAFVLMIALIVWGIRACSNSAKPEETESKKPEKKPMPEALQKAIEQARWESLSPEEKKKELQKKKEEAEKAEAEKAEEEKKKAMELAEQDKTTVWRIVKEAVKEKLLSPRSASFPFAGWEYVECNDPGIYFVRAYVDAKNAFGAEIRQKFFAKVVKYENGKFEVIQLTFENPF